MSAKGITAKFRYLFCEPVFGCDDPKLRDRVLVEVFDDEGFQIRHRQPNTCWAHVLVGHRVRQIDDDE